MAVSYLQHILSSGYVPRFPFPALKEQSIQMSDMSKLPLTREIFPMLGSMLGENLQYNGYARLQWFPCWRVGCRRQCLNGGGVRGDCRESICVSDVAESWLLCTIRGVAVITTGLSQAGDG